MRVRVHAVQPLVGVWSDRSGKRAPFILGGAVLSATLALSFGNAQHIGELCGDVAADRAVARKVALLSFWGLDFAVNAMMVWERGWLVHAVAEVWFVCLVYV